MALHEALPQNPQTAEAKTETTPRAPMAWESEASDAVPEVYEVLIKDVIKSRFFPLFMIVHVLPSF